MGARTALSRGLRSANVDNVTPEQVHHAVTGSEAPSRWLPAHFVAAARLYAVVLTIYRAGPGHPTQSIGAGPVLATGGSPRIFLQLDRNGTHVEVARNVPMDALAFSRTADQYVDIGVDGNG